MFPQTRVNSTERSCHCWKSGSRVLPCPQSVDTPHHIYCPFLDLEYMARVKCGRVWIGHQKRPSWARLTRGMVLVANNWIWACPLQAENHNIKTQQAVRRAAQCKEHHPLRKLSDPIRSLIEHDGRGVAIRRVK